MSMRQEIASRLQAAALIRPRPEAVMQSLKRFPAAMKNASTRNGKIIASGDPNIKYLVIPVRASFHVWILSTEPVKRGGIKSAVVKGVTYWPIGLVILETPKVLGKSTLGATYRKGGVYTPHAFIHPEYRGQGLGTIVYTWFLNAGHCLMSGSGHTRFARAMWMRLAKKYRLLFFDTKTRSISTDDQPSRTTRLVLLGKGWTLPKIKKLLLD